MMKSKIAKRFLSYGIAISLCVGLYFVSAELLRAKDPNEISGMVFVDGKQVQHGRLVFTPEQVVGEIRYRSFVDIKNGEFVSDAESPITPGHNAVLVGVHTDKQNSVISFSDLARFQFINTNVHVEDGGASEMELHVTSSRPNRVRYDSATIARAHEANREKHKSIDLDINLTSPNNNAQLDDISDSAE